MPYGYLIGVLLHGALVTLTSVAPRRPRWLVGLGFRVASAYNEIPVPIALLIIASTIPPLLGGQFTSPFGWVSLGVAVLVLAGLGVLAWGQTKARPTVRRALQEGLGEGWRTAIDDELLKERRDTRPVISVLAMPFVIRPPEVERIANISYGDAGHDNLLDLYRLRSRPANAPVLVYFHGGGYYGGRKSVEGRALLFHLARQGWVTISANYRLRPRAGFVDHLIDAKKVLAWIRRHGPEYGADPATLFLSGGSAGGHLSALAALTQNDPRYQPGFEQADTSVTGVASFYGWYGGYYGIGGADSEAGPLGHDASNAPPFFIAHGAKDPLAGVKAARRFVAHLRSNSSDAVVYAELPWGQHAFDLFHSLRNAAVVDGAAAFAAWVRSRRQ